MNIDLSTVTTERELHELLARCLSFPSFYGQNWDAFWDSISGLVSLPEKIIFTGSSALKNRLPSSYEQFKNCFNELAEECPDISCAVYWE